jgi:hypothetical protein
LAQYKHQQEANQVASSFIAIINLLTDATPDSQQVATLFTDAIGVITGLTGVLSGESQKQAKLKFLIAVGLAIGKQALDSFIPDAS